MVRCARPIHPLLGIPKILSASKSRVIVTQALLFSHFAQKAILAHESYQMGVQKRARSFCKSARGRVEYSPSSIVWMLPIGN
jgi:hypothetical protein